MDRVTSQSQDSNLAVSTNKAVVSLFGDGEPKTISGYIEQLVRINGERGIENDSYSLGGVVAELESRVANMLGKETAVFLPTGTMANHFAIRRLCGQNPRAVVQEQSHLYHDCGDTVQQLSGINLVPLAHDRPYFTLAELESAVDQSVSGRVLTPIGALMIESPVRRQHGQTVPLSVMEAITEYCRGRGIGTHLDGARLFMMSAASGVTPAEYSALFDTVYISMYKYFGAPYGGVLAGPASLLEGMYHERRMFGGALASTALAAAIALEGMDGFEARFGSAMERGRDLLKAISQIEGLEVTWYQHGSNIFPVRLARNIDGTKFVEALRSRSINLWLRDGSETEIDIAINTSILRQSLSEMTEAFVDAIAAAGSVRTD